MPDNPLATPLVTQRQLDDAQNRGALATANRLFELAHEVMATAAGHNLLLAEVLRQRAQLSECHSLLAALERQASALAQRLAVSGPNQMADEALAIAEAAERLLLSHGLTVSPHHGPEATERGPKRPPTQEEGTMPPADPLSQYLSLAALYHAALTSPTWHAPRDGM